MIRTISNMSVLNGVSIPSDPKFFEFYPKRAIGIFNGRYFISGNTLAQTDADVGFVKQTGLCTVQSNGVFSDLHSFVPTARIVIVTDPDDASKSCWLLRCSSTDLDTAGTGAKRSEFAGGSVSDVNFSFGVATRIAESWSGTSDQQIIFQIHGGFPISPILSAVVFGATIQISLRHGTSTQPKHSILYTGEIDVSWDRWVVSGLTHESRGDLQISRNGQIIVSYRGPFGYADNLMDGYIKCGFYHWTGNGNTWDNTISDRGVYIKGFWQIDPGIISHTGMVEFMQSV